MSKLSQQAPRPRPHRRRPAYPRALGVMVVGAVAGGALAMAAACSNQNDDWDGELGGVAAGAYHPGGAGGEGGAVEGGGGAGGDAAHGWGGYLGGEMPGGFAPVGGAGGATSGGGGAGGGS
jgi:hypothetical protein